VIVTMPQNVSLEDASRGLQMFAQLEVPILGVIENMSYLTLPDGTKMDVFGQGGGQQLANNYNVPFLGAVPLNPEVRVGGDSGKPIIISDPESDAALALQEIAQAVAARVSVAALSSGDSLSINIVD
jgi:ATP-binding protein involved in chromosome partitioning